MPIANNGRRAWLKEFNSVLLTILIILVSIITKTFFDFRSKITEDVENLSLQVALSEAIGVRTTDDAKVILIRVERLEDNQVSIRADQISKDVVIEMMNKQKDWVEQYFNRK